MKKKSVTVLLTTLLVATALMSCRASNGDSGKPGDDRPRVYSSFYTMYDFTRLIAGDEVEVINLVPFGVEAHDWEPSPQDIIQLEEADAFIYNGMAMESWVDDVLRGIENDSLLVIETTRDLEAAEHGHDTDEGHEHEEDQDDEGGHSHDGVDPHVWLDPFLALAQMETIRDGLIELKPESKAVFEKNFSDAKTEIEKLDDEYHAVLDQSKHKSFIVEHEAFHYLAEAYNLEQIAINNVHGSEPDPRQLAKVIDLAKAAGITTVYYEGVEAGNITRMLADDLGGEILRLNPFEGLGEDEIRAGKNYFTVMRENLEALKKGLN